MGEGAATEARLRTNSISCAKNISLLFLRLPPLQEEKGNRHVDFQYVRRPSSSRSGRLRFV